MPLAVDKMGNYPGRTKVAAPPPSTPEPPSTTPEWKAAVERATSQRAAADGTRPRVGANEQPYVIQSGDTMTDIAARNHMSLSGLAKTNAQVSDIDRIQTGEVVFVPREDPNEGKIRESGRAAEDASNKATDLEQKSRDPSIDPATRKEYRIDATDARRVADAKWTEFNALVGGEIRQSGENQAFPDEASRPRVETLKGYFPNDARALQEIDKADAAVNEDWKQTRLTKGEFNTLISDAQAADREAARLDDIARDPSLPSDRREFARNNAAEAHADANAKWSKLTNATQRELRHAGNAKVFPEEVASERYDTLKATAPQDPRAQAAIDTGFNIVKTDWQKQGWTRDKFGVVLDKHDALVEAKNTDPGKVEQRRGELDREIETQLKSAGDSAPPGQRELAIAGRGALLVKFGPDDPEFRDAVDRATYNVVVKPGVDAVRQAYGQGGGKAAAEELEKQTRDVSPETAARMIAGMPEVIDGITQYLGKSSYGPESTNPDEMAKTYGQLALSTDRAARSANGKSVVADVARMLVQHMPQTIARVGKHGDNPLGMYGEAFFISLSRGQGASLSLAATIEMKHTGQTARAEFALIALADGIVELQSQTDKAVTDFGKATETVSQLRANLAPFMTPEQLDLATIGYVERNQNIVKDFDNASNAVDGLGYGIVRTNYAISEALPELADLKNAGHLDNVRKNFAGTKEAAFAMGMSGKGRDEVTRIVLEKDAAQAAGKINPTSTVTGSRGFLKEFVNSQLSSSPATTSAIADAGDSSRQSTPTAPSKTKITDVFGSPDNPPKEIKVDGKKVHGFGASMNFLGAVFNGYQTFQSYEKLSSQPTGLLDQTKAVYYAIGTAKETTELFAALAQRGWRGFQFISTDFSGSVAAKAARTGLASEAGWVKFSTYFKIGGGLIDGAFAVDAFVKGEWQAGILYSVAATGGGLMAASSIAASGGWLAAAGPWGAGLVLASAIGLMIYNSVKSADALEGPTREFLKAADIKPEIASALADNDGSGNSMIPRLAATAQQFGVDPHELLGKLNTMDPGKVHQLVEAAKTVTPNDAGELKVTAENDRNVRGPDNKYVTDPQNGAFRGVTTRELNPSYPFNGQPQYKDVTREDTAPRSQTALRDYARAVFGQPLLG